MAPPRTRPAIIEAFVHEHREWIARTRSQFAELRPPEPTLPDTIALPALQDKVRLHFVASDKSSVREHHGVVTVRAPELHPDFAWPLLREWLKKRAKAVLPELCIQAGRRIGLVPRAVHIRLQKTRWGSCTSNGTINLNAALLLRPADEMHYVLIHELCHLQHMNHSKRYWALVGEHVPNWKRLDKKLDAAWQSSPGWLIG